MPYGATLHGLPLSASCPPDCFTWYPVTGWSAQPTCEWPLRRSASASVCFVKLWTVMSTLPPFLQLSASPLISEPSGFLPMYPYASASSVVPVSTATVRPHRSAGPLIVGPPDFVYHDSPALK